ncbi:MAG: homocysteine S-methyltransferase family protein [Anaerolineales bacterium]
MQTNLGDLLGSGNPVLADGAVGTMLFDLGLDQGDPPELWNLDHPDSVSQVHQDYIASGSQIILTNSFGANRILLQRHGLGDQADKINLIAAQLARVQADAAPVPVAVGGSMGPTGAMMEPLGDLSFEVAQAAFEEQAGALTKGGVDALWIETMYDIEEVRAAVDGCKSAAPDLPIVATMTFDTAGHTMMGLSPEDAAEMLAELGVIALGGNCGNGPEEIHSVVRKMRGSQPGMVLTAKSNAGIPHLVDGAAVYDATPEDMAEYALQALEEGAQIIGACCGSTPAHVRAMAEALQHEAA